MQSNINSKMDEANQQQTDSEAVLKDCDISLKGIADEKVSQELPRKSGCDTSSSAAVIESLNTNGIDKESEAFTNTHFTKGDLESIQSYENAVQAAENSSDNLQGESGVELSAACEDFSDSLKKYSKEVDEIKTDLGKSEQNYSNIQHFNKSDVSLHQKDEELYDSVAVKTIGISESHLTESIENDKECKETDLNEKNNVCESGKTAEDSSSVNLKDQSPEIDSKNELINPSPEKCNVNELLNSSLELTIKKDEVEGSESKNEIVTPLEEIVNESETTRQTGEADSNTKLYDSVNKSDQVISDNKSDASSTKITKVTDEQKVEKEEENMAENFSQPSLASEALDVNEDSSQDQHDEKLKDVIDSNINELESEMEKKDSDSCSGKFCIEMEKKVIDADNSEVQSELESELKDTSSNELQSYAKDKLIDENSSNLQSGTENGETNLNISMPEVIPVEINSSKKVTNPQEDKEDEADECESSQKLLETPLVESVKENSEKLLETPLVESVKENSEKLFETPLVESVKENSEKLLETPLVESVKENSDLGDKTSVQEYSQDVNRLSTSAEQEEEESTTKSENEGNEVMDTEMVNCNEIEQIDLSENENDLKGDGRDEEMADSLATSGEKNNEYQMAEGREDSTEAEKSAMLIDEEGENQPGNSEEETITGDTTNQTSTDLSKEKDEEICIIPDDVLPALTILPQTKDTETREGASGGLTVLKVTPSESVKPKTRAQDKRSQGFDSKSRPVRNAAKLAGNKIKSLVESDLVFDEQSLSSNLERENDVRENTDESAQMCAQCREVKVCKLLSVQNDITQYLCSEQCSTAFKAAQIDAEPTETDSSLREYVRKCGQCHSQITVDENRLFWETVDFCNEDCLGKYQLELGSNCANCKKSVPSVSLGKYCVRFGYDIKQFCSALCLEEYKKGLKVCSYCQKDISTGTEGFLAPVGNKGQFKDFCTQSCMEKYDRMSSNKPLPEIIEECAVCSNSKPVQVEVELDNKTHKLCSEPCFAAFKFVNNITEGQCDMCRKYFDRTKIPNYSLRLLFYDETLHSFCSKTCMNVYILANRKIVPCNWCKVKKYNFDMIKKVNTDGQLTMMCSLNCLMLYQTSVNAVCSRPIKCDFCKKKFVRQPLYHLTMSDATLRNFCSYNCVMSFQNGYPKQKIDIMSGSDQLNSPIPTGGPKRIAPKRPQVESTCVPVISSVQSLASPNGPVSPTGRVQISRGEVNMVSQPLSVPASPIPAPPPQIYQQIITKPAPAKQMKNKSVLCKPYSHTKGVSCRPHPCMKETQTDQSLNRKFLIPIPVPIYVPAPMHMFATPFPVPVPFPLPVPVPIFIPTTRNSAKGIMKEIKKIQEKIPTDPFEAELLMMAEMVAGEKKQDPTDSESEDGNDGDDNGDGTFSPENVDTSNTFGDDVLQMALKMASELEEPAVDMESVLTSNTITTSTQPAVDPNKALYATDTDDPDQMNVMAMNRGRKRSVRGSRNSTGGTPSKRGRRTSGSVDVPLLPPPEPVPPRTIEVEKPDANMCLKYTFGVNAWRHWVMQKNAELEKAALTNRKIKLFKPELLQLTADELNFSLCLFVKEVRKPNGTEYAPDTIYYLCLGIQQYLFENGRIDNIFTDSYYEKFTDCLDEVAKKFAALYNDSQYIVTRVEEEHLWESKQLGAHSPHVLLSTLMFFNTKHFNLVTVEEHMQLSFSHIMKHWKRNPNTPGVAKVPGSRNVLLRFYPPQSALEANSRKKKVYEQQENEENPLRCPVKLYEFYLSKCPESVKTRNDVFYLLPERSCVPDSPVWYSTMALGKEPLMKMLHRIKMVKEINIALLTS